MATPMKRPRDEPPGTPPDAPESVRSKRRRPLEEENREDKGTKSGSNQIQPAPRTLFQEFRELMGLSGGNGKGKEPTPEQEKDIPHTSRTVLYARIPPTLRQQQLMRDLQRRDKDPEREKLEAEACSEPKSLIRKECQMIEGWWKDLQEYLHPRTEHLLEDG
jgi:hypothetical protein